ncbi:MAG: hypothetical protein ACJAV2_004744 [Myxococcota bacterium]|jgi:hypothetical protein
MLEFVVLRLWRGLLGLVGVHWKWKPVFVRH